MVCGSRRRHSRPVGDAVRVGEFDRPFVGSLAVSAGSLTNYQLAHDFVRIYRDVYVAKAKTIDAADRARAAALYAGRDAVLTGFSAAALYGTKWIPGDEPAEIVRIGHLRAPKALTIRDYRLELDEIAVLDGIRLTTPARAAFDLGRTLRPWRAIAVLDALCRATDLKPHDVLLLSEKHAGARGIVALRSLLDDVDAGAESPPESHTRKVIIDAGLPRPETQIAITDEHGRIVARADLGWRKWRVIVEYDGEHHWTDRGQRAWDIERTAILEALGWTVIRVGAELLYDRPGELVRRVRVKLREAGAPI